MAKIHCIYNVSDVNWSTLCGRPGTHIHTPPTGAAGLSSSIHPTTMARNSLCSPLQVLTDQVCPSVLFPAPSLLNHDPLDGQGGQCQGSGRSGSKGHWTVTSVFHAILGVWLVLWSPYSLKHKADGNGVLSLPARKAPQGIPA